MPTSDEIFDSVKEILIDALACDDDEVSMQVAGRQRLVALQSHEKAPVMTTVDLGILPALDV